MEANPSTGQDTRTSGAAHKGLLHGHTAWMSWYRLHTRLKTRACALRNHASAYTTHTFKIMLLLSRETFYSIVLFRVNRRKNDVFILGNLSYRVYISMEYFWMNTTCEKFGFVTQPRNLFKEIYHRQSCDICITQSYNAMSFIFY